MTTLTYTTLASLVAGSPEKIADVVDCLQKIQTVLNGNIDSATNLTPGGVTDASLASPTNAVWRTVATCQGSVVGVTTSLFYFSTTGSVQSGVGGSLTSQGLWVPQAADIAVVGKTTRLRLEVPWITNAVAPAVTITWGLYPVSAIAGSGTVIVTLGTVVAGSTASVASPGSGSASQATSAGFDISAVTGGNVYIIGVTASGTQAANSIVGSQPYLKMRHT